MKFYSAAARFFATGFYLGLLPSRITGGHKGGGTLGTLLGLVLIPFLPADKTAYSIFLCVFAVFAVAVSHKTCSDYGTKDDQRVVIDETAGYFTAMAWLPREPLMLAATFLLFRVFDGLKPWPIGAADRSVSGGVGVVLDDLLAGAATNLVIRAVLYFIN